MAKILESSKRRWFLKLTGTMAMGLLTAGAWALTPKKTRPGKMNSPSDIPGADPRDITIFCCGDVMTGRGIDQVLPYPGHPRIYESYVQQATRYVEIAEAANGPIPRPVDFNYIWGDALVELERVSPDTRIINLETAVTTSDNYWRGKGINYRMHPRNVPCIAAAKIDICALANNHVLDWDYAGLRETLDTLNRINVKTTGAGRNADEARAPAIHSIKGKGRVIVFSAGLSSSGIPGSWVAAPRKAGVNLLSGLTEESLSDIADHVGQVKRPGDLVVFSVHWGGNWGYEIPAGQRKFAHQLVDTAGVDMVHGHSSHHAKGIEIYKGKPIVYGCGDFINDYEGIRGKESYRGDLSLMYFVTMSPATGKLSRLGMTPQVIRRFRLEHAGRADARWLRDTLNREGKRLGTRVELQPGDVPRLRIR